MNFFIWKKIFFDNFLETFQDFFKKILKLFRHFKNFFNNLLELPKNLFWTFLKSRHFGFHY